MKKKYLFNVIINSSLCLILFCIGWIIGFKNGLRIANENVQRNIEADIKIYKRIVKKLEDDNFNKQALIDEINKYIILYEEANNLVKKEDIQ